MLEWSFQTFITADNNLFGLVASELDQFRHANPRNVNVVVQADTPHYRTERLVLNRDGSFPVLPPRGGTFANVDAGKPQTLVNFLFASKHLRQGYSTVVVLNGHGTGLTDQTKMGHFRSYRGYKPGAIALGIDDTSRDFLDNNELARALDAFRRRTKKDFRKIAILGCDACLMGTVEIAHQLRDHARYYVASQDNEPVDGWPYREILKTFNNRVKPRRAAINIVDAYGDATRNDAEATLSAVDLDAMNALATALDQLGNALLPFVRSEMRVLARAREDARAFANFDSIDLYGYVEALKARFELSEAGNARVTAAADAALKALDNAVVATSKDPKISGAHGLSVYLPNSPVIDAYHDFPLSTDAPRWHEFVTQYGANRHRV